MVLFLTFLALLIPVYSQSVPKFQDFPVPIYKGKVVPPQQPSESDRKMRCCTWAEDLGPINFAGHFRLTEDTCGSECRTIHVVDRKTGRHFDLGSFGRSYRIDFPKLPRGTEFRSDSRLIIIHGCAGEANCGSHYVLISKAGAKRIHYVPFEFARQ